MKEKWVRINTIEGYEDIKDQYWISNSDEDVIINRSTNKRVKGSIDDYGYKRIGLRIIDGKYKKCRIHVIKAKAFLFGPNPLSYNVIRHLNDIPTDNRLINLAWGTQSDNVKDCIKNGNYNYEAAVRGGKISGKITGAKNGKITGAKNGKKRSKPVKCVETGMIYTSVCEAERQTGIPRSSISNCCIGRRHTAGGFHWEFVNQISE